MTDRSVASATDHRGLRVLDFAECVERLHRATVGRIGFVHDGDPVILPVHHAVDGDVVVFRTQPGSKLDVAASARSVAFEVDAHDDGTRTGWSVLVKGVAEVVYDAAETSRYDALGLDSWVDDEPDESRWVRIRALEISGREIGG